MSCSGNVFFFSFLTPRNYPTMNKYYQFEEYIVSYLSKIEFLRPHFEDPVSQTITALGFVFLGVIIIHKIIHDIGVYLNLWEEAGKEFKITKPVHCAHLYVNGHLSGNVKGHVKDSDKVLKFHIEFSPEEYHEDDPELGSTLGFLRKKLYFLFKDSLIYENLKLNKTFTINDVEILNSKGIKVTEDSKPLCLMNIETGNTITAYFNI